MLTEEYVIEYNIVLQYRGALSMLDREFFLGFIKIHLEISVPLIFST